MPTAAAMPVNLADFTFIQYPAREQAELRVRIKIPGVWFQGLSGAERSVKYEAEAYDFVDAHVFKKNGKAQPPCPAIKFLCEEDVFEDPKHAGFLMPLHEWNRYRNDTYIKDDCDAELPSPLPSEPRTREV